MKMRTPKQIEDWTFSVNGSEQTNDDTNKNITENSNITLVQEESLEEKCCAYECQLKNCQERIKVLELEQSKSSLENTVAQQKERLENIEEINKVDANQRVKELKRINEVLEKLKSLLNNIVAKQTEKIQNLEGQIIVVNDKRKELSERLNKAESELAELTNKLAKKVENSQENINSKVNNF
uniref:Uncharacterized protein n=1 Tax=Meloidogyne hapla TaxID=6305 RepID=A0A1I8B4U2_MELHA